MIYCTDSGRYFGTHGGWWPCEVNVLKSMVKEGISVRKIAQVLDRSYRSVYQKAKKEEGQTS